MANYMNMEDFNINMQIVKKRLKVALKSHDDAEIEECKKLMFALNSALSPEDLEKRQNEILLSSAKKKKSEREEMRVQERKKRESYVISAYKKMKDATSEPNGPQPE